MLKDTKCKLCGYIFSHKYNLKRHLEENLCKEMNNLNLYEIYVKFNKHEKLTKNIETQTESKIKCISSKTQSDKCKVKSINVQTISEEIKTRSISTQIELDKYKMKNISSQTKFDDININKELYPIEKVKIDYIKFKSINKFIENYKYDTKMMCISKILEIIFCNIQYTQNHVIKYTKTYPNTFVFLSNKSKEGNECNESKYLQIGNYDCIIQYFHPHIKKILLEIYKNCVNDCKINHDWDIWYDFNKDEINKFNKDIKDNKIIKECIKYFLKNVVVNHRILKYKI